MKQQVVTVSKNLAELDEWLIANRIKKLFLVCDESLGYQKVLAQKIIDIGNSRVKLQKFSDFQPNPLYESVVKGIKLFCNENCDGIMAVGGGSSIDVAKCIKLYSGLYTGKESDGANGAWIGAETNDNRIPFLALPTTAGTGSEATRFAVVYYNGVKQSITSESVIPGTVFLDPDTLVSLPLYQKKATMCDALCHGIESFWSVNSTEESKKYSKRAIRSIMENMDRYLTSTYEANSMIMMASHVAGKAINITKTTAGHAMCYKITSMFGCAHGHASILCDSVLYPWMIQNVERCVDSRGSEYLYRVLDQIGIELGGIDARSGAMVLEEIVRKLFPDVPMATELQIKELTRSVNSERLNNHPIRLEDGDIELLYREMLSTRYV